MGIAPPNDGLEGLAPVEPQEPAGIMPNKRHQEFPGFMTGAPASVLRARGKAAPGEPRVIPLR